MVQMLALFETGSNDLIHAVEGFLVEGNAFPGFSEIFLIDFLSMVCVIELLSVSARPVLFLAAVANIGRSE